MGSCTSAAAATVVPLTPLNKEQEKKARTMFELEQEQQQQLVLENEALRFQLQMYSHELSLLRMRIRKTRHQAKLWIPSPRTVNPNPATSPPPLKNSLCNNKINEKK